MVDDPLIGSSRRSATLFALVLAVFALTGCSVDDAAPQTSATPESEPTPATSLTGVPSVTPTSPTTTSATTIPTLVSVLELDPTERLATRNGVSIDVIVSGDVVATLSDAVPTAEIDTVPGASVELRYVAPDGSPADVGWEQVVGASPVVVVQPWRESRSVTPSLLVAWQTGVGGATWRSQLDAAPQVNVTSPMSWFVSEEGDLVGSVDARFVTDAHDRGLVVWPAVQGLSADALHVFVGDEQRRRAAAARIAADAEAAGADGVNVDLEGFRNEDAAGLTAFVAELADAVHGWGGVVSYDLVPRTDDWDVQPAELDYWSTAPQRRALAEVVDYTVLMAYDQHNRFRPAGPVAAPSWVEETIVYMLRYADPHTVLLGIPAYGRLWNEAELDQPRAISLGYFDGLSGERSHDQTFGMDHVDLGDGTFYWVDNEVEADRVVLAETYGLAGWAVWRLGLDDAGLWDEFATER